MLHFQRLTPRGGARPCKCLRIKGLPTPCVLLPVVVVEAGLLEALVAASALHEVVAALHAGSSVFLIGWLVCACGLALALGACGGFFIHHKKHSTHIKKRKRFFYFFKKFFCIFILDIDTVNCEIAIDQIVKIENWFPVIDNYLFIYYWNFVFLHECVSCSAPTTYNVRRGAPL